MTSTEIERPWLHVELIKDTKARSLSDEVVEILEGLFTDDVDNALSLATAPDNEDAVTGNVKYDRVLLASAVKQMATNAHPQVQAVKIDKIVPLLNRCAKRIGVDRMAIAARKADFLAIQASEPMGEQPEPSMNEQHHTAQPE